MKLLLTLFLAGFFLGPIGDYAHVATGTTGYPEGYAFYILGLPWWVPLLFGSAALSIGATHPSIDRHLGASPERAGSRGWKGVFAGMVGFIGLYVISGMLPSPGGVSDVLLAAGAIAMWAALDRTWQGALLAASTALSGTAFEMFLVSNGVFFYQPGADNFFGVASWLPWLYVAASIAVANFARKLGSDLRLSRSSRS